MDKIMKVLVIALLVSVTLTACSSTETEEEDITYSEKDIAKLQRGIEQILEYQESLLLEVQVGGAEHEDYLQAMESLSEHVTSLASQGYDRLSETCDYLSLASSSLLLWKDTKEDKHYTRGTMYLNQADKAYFK